MSSINDKIFDRELKKGGAELLVLSLLEARMRHGYELRKLIEKRSDGVLKFNAASLYPLLYRLEKRGWIEGKWVEKAGQRRSGAKCLIGTAAVALDRACETCRWLRDIARIGKGIQLSAVHLCATLLALVSLPPRL